MTDNEIIKALECCTNNISSCKDCLYEFSHTENKWCDEVLIEDAFALITRQKAEIERLEKGLEKRTTELDRLTIYFDRAVEEKLKTAKAEAIKECTDKLKSIYGEWLYDYRVDDLFKGMGG